MIHAMPPIPEMAMHAATQDEMPATVPLAREPTRGAADDADRPDSVDDEALRVVARRGTARRDPEDRCVRECRRQDLDGDDRLRPATVPYQPLQGTDQREERQVDAGDREAAGADETADRSRSRMGSCDTLRTTGMSTFITVVENKRPGWIASW